MGSIFRVSRRSGPRLMAMWSNVPMVPIRIRVEFVVRVAAMEDHLLFCIAIEEGEKVQRVQVLYWESLFK